MSEEDPTPEESFAWAQERIAAARAGSATYLDLDYPEGHALERLPDALGDLTQLEILDLRNTQVSDLRALEGLSGLQVLYLDNTQVSDLRGLEGLSGLQWLSLDNTQVSDLRLLEGLSGLQELYLNNTQVSDLRLLEGLSGLQVLSLNSTPVSDLRVLEGLSGLQWLSLNNTQVSDLRVLEGLSGLQGLSLKNTQVSDLLPLVGLSKLGDEVGSALLFPGLNFTGTPAAERDDPHRALASIADNKDCAKQVLQFLNGEHPEFGGPPKPFVRPPPPPPPDEPSEGAEGPPEQQRGGVRFRSEDNYLEPLSEGEIGKRAAVMKPSILEALEELAAPLPGSNDFPEPAKWAVEALMLVRRDLEDIDAEGYRLWLLSQKIALRQERDKAAQADASGMSKTMSPEMREALDGVVATLPLFVRQFPECRYYDSETAAREIDLSAEPAVSEVLSEAKRHEIVRDEVADTLLANVPVGSDGQEAARVGGFNLWTTRNLVYAGLGVVATAAVGVVVTETVGGVMDGLGTRKMIEVKVREWLTSKPEPIAEILKGAPSDVQASVRAQLERLKAEPAPWEARIPPRKP